MQIEKFSGPKGFIGAGRSLIGRDGASLAGASYIYNSLFYLSGWHFFLIYLRRGAVQI